MLLVPAPPLLLLWVVVLLLLLFELILPPFRLCCGRSRMSALARLGPRLLSSGGCGQILPLVFVIFFCKKLENPCTDTPFPPTHTHTHSRVHLLNYSAQQALAKKHTKKAILPVLAYSSPKLRKGSSSERLLSKPLGSKIPAPFLPPFFGPASLPWKTENATLFFPFASLPLPTLFLHANLDEIFHTILREFEKMKKKTTQNSSTAEHFPRYCESTTAAAFDGMCRGLHGGQPFFVVGPRRT